MQRVLVHRVHCLNRTIMELKWPNDTVRHKEIMVLIAPYWNCNYYTAIFRGDRFES